MLNNISGVLIFLSFLFTNIAYFIDSDLLIYASCFAWIAFLLLFITLGKKKIIVTLLILSLLCFLFSYIKGFDINVIKALSINQYLLTLLIGVSLFKTYCHIQSLKKKAKVESGKSSFLKPI